MPKAVPVGVEMQKQLNKKEIEVCPVLAGPVQGKVKEELTFAGGGLPNLAGATAVLEFATTASAGGLVKVGALFSGGPAPGGHNVIAGIYDYLQAVAPGSEVFGFAEGAAGLVKGEGKWLTAEMVAAAKNTGGFDLLGSSRKKLESEDDFKACLETMKKLGLKGVAVIGGDDSNTNAAFLADYFKGQGADIAVVGVPKTIDGDLQAKPYVPISFGFHTAARLYCELVGNITKDVPSTRRYWHFIKLMGRSASHLTLEVALQTQPNVALIGEEIKAKRLTLDDVAGQIAEVVAARAAAGKKYGVILIPEGIVEFIPEMGQLIARINKAIGQIGNEKFAALSFSERMEKVLVGLDQPNENLLASLPREIQQGMLSELDPHGNVQLSQIPSEKLFIRLVNDKLKEQGVKMGVQGHFFGYEGRCGYPTWFDATYTYNLGRIGAALMMNGYTGYLAAISNLKKKVEAWQPLGVPLAGLMRIEHRQGKDVLVLGKALVELDDPAFKYFAKRRGDWALADSYVSPGPIQYFGPKKIVQERPMILQLNTR